MECDLVSVIVPVYNTAEYLPKCISSICSQTYSKLEIIVVDDGSTDSSPEMCDQYAELDSRVNVIHKANGGLSSARQAGILAAHGQFLMIIDSDDWIDPETVDVSLHYAQETNTDCVMFGYVREYPDKSIPNPLFQQREKLSVEEAERRIHRRIVGPLAEELLHPERVDNYVSVCMKLYKVEVARRGRIVSEREIGTSEDTVFNLYALENCRIGCLPDCFYHYRKMNAQSITTQHKPDLAEKWDVLYQVIQEYISGAEHSETYLRPFLNRVACCTIGLGLNEIGSSTSIFSKAKRMNEILRKSLYRQAFLQFDTRHCPMYWKAFFWLCKWKTGFLLTVLLTLMQRLRARG